MICEECGVGAVRSTVRRNHEVKFDRVPFVVPEAVIGVCDKCGEEYVDAVEYKRWRRLFELGEEAAGGLLSPLEITSLRVGLWLSMSDFAALIGATRQSIHHWEKEDRVAPQSRMADLMLRVIDESLEEGEVDVVEFLAERAKRAGVAVRVPKAGGRSSRDRACRRNRGQLPTRDAYDKLWGPAVVRISVGPSLAVIPSR